MNRDELRELADRLSEHAEHHDYIRANDDEQAQWADDLTATAAYLREQADRMEQEAVAWVLVHPQHGPLWANATAEPNRERLPSYPLQAVYFHPAAPSPTCIGSDPACPCQDGDACHYRDAADGTQAMRVPERQPMTEAQAEYQRANPLGGPAAMFDAIANRLRAGEPFDAVMRDYGVTFSGIAPKGETKC